MLKRNHRMLAIFLVVILLLACAPVVAVTPAVAPPTFDPLSLNTIIAQTAGAAATQTFVLQPTLTPTATITKTPTEVPTSTPTFIFVLFTPTVPSLTPTLGASTAEYACQIVSQTPADNTVLGRGLPFKAHWQVINIGTFAWDENSADYRYVSGDKLHKRSVFDFEHSVSTGGAIDFLVEMRSPDEPGTYTTTWRISVGNRRFCPMSITIVVN